VLVLVPGAATPGTCVDVRPAPHAAAPSAKPTASPNLMPDEHTTGPEGDVRWTVEEG